MSNKFYMPAPATPATFEELRRYVQTELDRIEKGFTKAGNDIVTGGGGDGDDNIDGGDARMVYLPSQKVDGGTASG